MGTSIEPCIRAEARGGARPPHQVALLSSQRSSSKPSSLENWSFDFRGWPSRPDSKAMDTLNYSGISAAGGSRQHNGNVINTTTNNYHGRLRGSAETQAELNTKFLKAASEGQTARLRALYERGADPDFARSSDGLTALHFACWSEYEDTVFALLEMNVDVNPYSEEYGTPIMIAAGRGRRNVFHALLKHRADPHLSGGKLGTTLHAAAVGGDEEIVGSLLALGQSVHLEATAYPELPRCHVRQVFTGTFHCTYRFHGQPLPLTLTYERTAVLNLLLNHGADVNRMCVRINLESGKYEQFTCLQLAANDSRSDILLLLLERGADPNANPQVGSALAFAAFMGDIQSVRILLDHGAQIDLRRGDGMTALMWAARVGHLKVLELLLDRGASTNNQLKSGETALDLAKLVGHKDCIELLEAYEKRRRKAEVPSSAR